MSDTAPPGPPEGPDATPPSPVPPPQPDGIVDLGDATPDPVVPECEECHSPLEPDQPYCLVCGAPTPRALNLRPRGRSAGVWIALGLLGLAVGAGALAWVLWGRDDPTTAQGSTGVTTLAPPTTGTVTALPTAATTGPYPTDPTLTSVTLPTTPITSGTFSTPSSDTFVVTTAPPPTVPTAPPLTTSTGSETTTTPTFTESPTEPVTTDVASDWPSGTSAWTVIIASSTDAQAATTTRDDAQSKGYSPGILKSDDHQGLRAGYFVVYVGQFQSRNAVIRRVAELKQDYPKAYPRYINA